jgi:hypothetical protein
MRTEAALLTPVFAKEDLGQSLPLPDIEQYRGPQRKQRRTRDWLAGANRDTWALVVDYADFRCE